MRCQIIIFIFKKGFLELDLELALSSSIWIAQAQYAINIYLFSKLGSYTGFIYHSKKKEAVKGKKKL